MRPCGKCRLPVQWKIVGTKTNGNPQWGCFNADGTTEHWDTCSRERTRKALAEGTPFRDEQGEGVIYEGKKMYMHMVARSGAGR